MVYYNATKSFLSDQYKTKLGYINVLTALGTANAVGTEPTGGSPANARKALAWGTSTNGVVTTTAGAAIDVPAGATVVGVGLFDLATGAPGFYDQASVTSQAFASQGTYTATPTYTQT